MLAKIWKKVLLAICILACLFNVTSKLVNKKSLQANLDSIKDGMSISDMLKSFEEKDKSNLEIERAEKEHLITPNNIIEETNTIENDNDNGYVIIY
ncbi:MAG: hypothetical protein HFJ46_06740 [Clostridia bacterium]|nr:hypothetical protein [Clostridia bacterium]